MLTFGQLMLLFILISISTMVSIFCPMNETQCQVVMVMFLIAIYEPFCEILWRCEATPMDMTSETETDTESQKSEA
jgi:hypothetical protein